MDAFLPSPYGAAGVCLETRPIEPSHLLRLTVTGDGSGKNCAERALAALALAPAARAVIGTVLVFGARCAVSGEGLRVCKPWGHHIWLAEGDQGFHDPSLQNLPVWAEQERVLLPRSLEGLAAVIVADPAAQAEVIRGAYLGAGFLCPPGFDLIYLPGLVFSSDLEELPSPPEYVHAWGRLASECRRDGGWSAAQLEEGLARVDGLLREAPNLRTSPIHPNRPKVPRRGGHGFGWRA